MTARAQPSVYLAGLLLLALLISGCKHQDRRPLELSLEGLVAEPQKFNRKVVIVTGCFVWDFDEAAGHGLVAVPTLRPCTDRSGELSVWLENAQVALIERTQPKPWPPEPPELARPREGPMPPEYDAGKSSMAWKALVAMDNSEHEAGPLRRFLKLLGQFETAVADHVKFGYTRKYQHRLILLELLEENHSVIAVQP